MIDLTPRGRKDGDCLVWTGFCNPHGYGQVRIKGRAYLVHRYALMRHVGRELTPSEFALHRCDNPPCFNVEHLYVGDAKRNAADMLERGRHRAPSGETHPHAKLTDAQVGEIRRRYRKQARANEGTGTSSAELAQEFGVTRSYVLQIAAGDWRMSRFGE